MARVMGESDALINDENNELNIAAEEDADARELVDHERRSLGFKQRMLEVRKSNPTSHLQLPEFSSPVRPSSILSTVSSQGDESEKVGGCAWQYKSKSYVDDHKPDEAKRNHRWRAEVADTVAAEARSEQRRAGYTANAAPPPAPSRVVEELRRQLEEERENSRRTEETNRRTMNRLKAAERKQVELSTEHSQMSANWNLAKDEVERQKALILEEKKRARLSLNKQSKLHEEERDKLTSEVKEAAAKYAETGGPQRSELLTKVSDLRIAKAKLEAKVKALEGKLRAEEEKTHEGKRNLDAMELEKNLLEQRCQAQTDEIVDLQTAVDSLNDQLEDKNRKLRAARTSTGGQGSGSRAGSREGSRRGSPLDHVGTGSGTLLTPSALLGGAGGGTTASDRGRLVTTTEKLRATVGNTTSSKERRSSLFNLDVQDDGGVNSEAGDEPDKFRMNTLLRKLKERESQTAQLTEQLTAQHEEMERRIVEVQEISTRQLEDLQAEHEAAMATLREALKIDHSKSESVDRGQEEMVTRLQKLNVKMRKLLDHLHGECEAKGVLNSDAAKALHIKKAHRDVDLNVDLGTVREVLRATRNDLTRDSVLGGAGGGEDGGGPGRDELQRDREDSRDTAASPSGAGRDFLRQFESKERTAEKLLADLFEYHFALFHALQLAEENTKRAEERVDQASAARDELEKKVSGELQHRIQGLEKDLERKESERKLISDKESLLEKRETALEDVVQKLKQKIADAESETDQQRKKVGELHDEVAALKFGHTSELQEVRKNLHKAQHDAETEHYARVQELNKAKLQAEHQAETVEQQNTTLRRNKDELQNTVALLEQELHQLKEDKHELMQTVDELNKQAARFLQEREDLVKSHEHEKARVQKSLPLAKYKAKIEQLTKIVDEKELAMQEFEANLKRQLANVKADLSKQLAEKNKEITKLQASLSKWQAKLKTARWNFAELQKVVQLQAEDLAAGNAGALIGSFGTFGANNAARKSVAGGGAGGPTSKSRRSSASPTKAAGGGSTALNSMNLNASTASIEQESPSSTSNIAAENSNFLAKTILNMKQKVAETLIESEKRIETLLAEHEEKCQFLEEQLAEKQELMEQFVDQVGTVEERVGELENALVKKDAETDDLRKRLISVHTVLGTMQGVGGKNYKGEATDDGAGGAKDGLTADEVEMLEEALASPGVVVTGAGAGGALGLTAAAGAGDDPQTTDARATSTRPSGLFHSSVRKVSYMLDAPSPDKSSTSKQMSRQLTDAMRKAMAKSPQQAKFGLSAPKEARYLWEKRNQIARELYDQYVPSLQELKRQLADVNLLYSNIDGIVGAGGAPGAGLEQQIQIDLNGQGIVGPGATRSVNAIDGVRPSTNEVLSPTAGVLSVSSLLQVQRDSATRQSSTISNAVTAAGAGLTSKLTTYSEEEELGMKISAAEKKAEFEFLLRGFEKQIAELAGRLSEWKARYVKSDKLREEADEREQGLLERLKAYIDVQQGKDAELSALDSESAQLQQAVYGYESQVAKYQAQLEESDRALQDMVQLHSEFEETKAAEVQALRDDLGRLDEEKALGYRDFADKHQAELAARYDEFEEEKIALRKKKDEEIHALKNEVRRLESGIAEKLAQIEDLQASQQSILHAAEEVKEETSEQLQSTASEKVELQRAARKREAQIRELQQQVEDLQEEQAVLTDRFQREKEKLLEDELLKRGELSAQADREKEVLVQKARETERSAQEELDRVSEREREAALKYQKGSEAKDWDLEKLKDDLRTTKEDLLANERKVEEVSRVRNLAENAWEKKRLDMEAEFKEELERLRQQLDRVQQELVHKETQLARFSVEKDTISRRVDELLQEQSYGKREKEKVVRMLEDEKRRMQAAWEEERFRLQRMVEEERRRAQSLLDDLQSKAAASRMSGGADVLGADGGPNNGALQLVQLQSPSLQTSSTLLGGGNIKSPLLYGGAGAAGALAIGRASVLTNNVAASTTGRASVTSPTRASTAGGSILLGGGAPAGAGMGVGLPGVSSFLGGGGATAALQHAKEELEKTTALQEQKINDLESAAAGRETQLAELRAIQTHMDKRSEEQVQLNFGLQQKLEQSRGECARLERDLGQLRDEKARLQVELQREDAEFFENGYGYEDLRRYSAGHPRTTRVATPRSPQFLTEERAQQRLEWRRNTSGSPTGSRIVDARGGHTHTQLQGKKSRTPSPRQVQVDADGNELQMPWLPTASQNVTGAYFDSQVINLSGPKIPRREVPARAYKGNDPQTLFHLAEHLCEEKKWGDAERMFLKLQTIVEKHGVAGEAGDQEKEMNLQENNKVFREISLSEIFAHLGVVMQSLDRVDDAIKYYHQAVGLDKQLHVCYANLASLYVYVGDGKKGRECIEEALTLDPGNETYIAIKGSLG
eukprot:g6483.t1